jgi:hypothetical protein
MNSKNCIHTIKRDYDLVVVGGGLSGMCAAIAAARHGAKTAIIQAHSVFGGNASSEIRMHIVGAGCHSAKLNSNETGILLELLLENKRRNPYHAFPVWDAILWEKVRFQENLENYLNTAVLSVEMDSNKIKSLNAYQQTTETEFQFSPTVVIDATGHGTVGVLAGAGYRTGSESKYEFGEPSAPEEANKYTMGNTLMFQAVDRGKPVEFIKPPWAYRFSEEDLKNRHHYNCTSAITDGGKYGEFKEGEQKSLPDFSRMDSGYWWIELGGDYDDIIAQGEEIRDELLKYVYGVWDHIKNCGDHGAANYDLEWVGMIPGYRESRRLEGDYFLNENDIRSNKVFSDAVAYGGWPMDNHVPGGIKSLDSVPSIVYNFSGLYTIPYRCYYSRNITNLMMAGRDISTSKMAFSSARVMGSCAVGGQAAGTAAALAIKYRCAPREIGNHITELQQLLLKDDCYIPGFVGNDPSDLAQKASVRADDFKSGSEPEKVLNGIARIIDKEQNCWESMPLGKDGKKIFLDLPSIEKIHEIRLTFDPNLTREIMPSITFQVKDRQAEGMPEELIKDYSVKLFNNGKEVFSKAIKDNYQRLNSIRLETEIKADSLCVHVHSTHGLASARIYEIRMY